MAYTDEAMYSYSLYVTGGELKDLRDLMVEHKVETVPDLLKVALKHLKDCPPSAAPAAKPASK